MIPDDPTETPALSVVMPAYRLGPVIASNILAVVAAIEGLNAEVVVVDDGSDDDTSSQAALAAERAPNVTVVRHEVNRGKGDALVTGTGHARGAMVCFLDADLDLPPDQIAPMVARLAQADVVVGAKRSSMSGGAYPTLRRLLSHLFAVATTGVFRLPIRETQTGLKVFKREVLTTVLPSVRLRGYAFDLELMVRAHRSGYRIIEVPVRLGPSASGAALRPRMLWELGRDTLRLAWWLLRGK
jgi:glycosyltransferase involved in cell wall biosynthesis